MSDENTVAPDRETQIKAAFEAGAKSFIRIDWDGPEDEVRIERMWQHHRDALLASGVFDGKPADLIRAEALEALVQAGVPDQEADGWILARAAEYRKAAGA